MPYNLLSPEDRKAFLKEANNRENQDRKSKSLAALEVYNDRAHDYVKAYLKEQYSENTVLQMPIVSSINLCKRVANKEASIYKNPPVRTFSGLTEDQSDELLKLYENSKINQKLFKSNVFFKVQNQNFLQVIPKDGKLIVRCLLPHHIDAVPSYEDPEKADAFVISSFDKALYYQTGDGANQKIGDQEDYKKQIYVAWTSNENLMFNGEGTYIGEQLPNPIGVLPFIDVHIEKDFEFFVRTGQNLVEFTIQYNGALSDLAQVVKMQGWAQAYLKGDKDLMPESITVGPNHILRLPVDANNQVQTEFGYASPNADVSGSIQHVENLLSNFLTSRGLDPNLVNGKSQASKFTSGMDRLLAMIEMFEASKQDYAVYQGVEYQLFELIKKWSQALAGTDDAFLSFAIPEDATMSCQYNQPEMVQTESDKLSVIQTKMEQGLMSRSMAIKELYELNDEEAVELMEKIDEEMMPRLAEPNDTKTESI